MRYKILRPAAVLACAAALTLAAACGNSTTGGSGGGGGAGGGGGSSSGPVTLGFMGAQTGPNAQLGINISNGAKLAIDQHNKSSKTKVTLKLYDTQGDPAQAPSQAKTAVQEKVVGIIGPAFSGESAAADPLFEQAGIPSISPSATAVSLGQNHWKFWHRIVSDDAVQGPADAKFMVNTLGAKRVAVVDDASDYGKPLGDYVRNEVKKLGGTVAVSQSIKAGASDYSSVVNAIKAGNVQAVFYGGYYSDAAKLAKQLSDAGVKAKFVSDDGTLDQKFVDGAGKSAADGAFVSCACVSSTSASSSAAAKKFASDYKSAYGSAPGTYSAEGYDAATAFLKAIDAGKTSPGDINDYLKTIDFNGVSKHIKFNGTGQLTTSSIFIYEVQNGTIKFLGNSTQAKPL
jgi:branched-chain amino acid transport system substrate-binding protein